MSKRYGRNQKRHHREEIAKLQEQAVWDNIAIEFSARRNQRLEANIRDWARRIVASLGEHSSFAWELTQMEWQGGEAMMLPLPPGSPLRMRMREAAEQMSEDLIRLFVHHVEAQRERDPNAPDNLRNRIVVQLHRGKEHVPIYLALSPQQMDHLLFSDDPNYMKFLTEGIARQLAKHAEEIRNGR